MSEEIGQATQIIRVAYDGIEIAMKLGGGGLKLMKAAFDFLAALMEREKTLGKTGMRKLLMKGGDLQVFQFNAGDLKKVEKMAGKYGILYSVLPDINQGDGKREIVFHSEAVPRVNMMVQKLNFGRITTFDDYLENGEEKEMEKILSFLKGQREGKEKAHTDAAVKADGAIENLIEKVGNYAAGRKSISVGEIRENLGIDNGQAEKALRRLAGIGLLSKGENGEHQVMVGREDFEERLRGYRQLAERMQAISAAKDTNLVDITISRNLITEENGHAVKTRVPGTWGENACYLWIGKKDILDIHGGKTILTSLDRDKEYTLYSADNRAARTMKGENLYTEHYDPVETEIRKRYKAATKPGAARRGAPARPEAKMPLPQVLPETVPSPKAPLPKKR